MEMNVWLVVRRIAMATMDVAQYQLVDVASTMYPVRATYLVADELITSAS
jgi:hypothetical protein